MIKVIGNQGMSEEDFAAHAVYHGYSGGPPAETFRPPLTVAISRETGSRGRTVARRAADLLGWRFVDQETLEFLCNSSSDEEELEDELSAVEKEWIDRRLQELFPSDGGNQVDPLLRNLVTRILEFALKGKSVLLGRGAGCILPSDARLNVRLVAPKAERITYVSQWQRLSNELATAFVEQRDAARQQFVSDLFGITPTDLAQYDMVLNTSTLGVEGCAQTIVTAVRQWEAHHE